MVKVNEKILIIIKCERHCQTLSRPTPLPHGSVLSHHLQGACCPGSSSSSSSTFCNLQRISPHFKTLHLWHKEHINVHQHFRRPTQNRFQQNENILVFACSNIHQLPQHPSWNAFNTVSLNKDGSSITSPVYEAYLDVCVYLFFPSSGDTGIRGSSEINRESIIVLVHYGKQ